jgi:hypothetical protein
MMRRLTVPFLALAVAGTVALGTPVAAQSTSSDLERIANSGQALIKAGSAKFTGKVDVSGAGVTSQQGAVSFSGAFNFKRRLGQFKIDAAALGTRGGAKITFLLVNDVAYIRLDALKGRTGTLPKALRGKKWLKLDLKALGAGSGTIGQTDPTSSLFALRGVTQGIQNLGTDQVGGVTTTHYRVQLDLAKALQQVPAGQRAAAQQALQALGTGIVPADVWLDRQNRLRRFSLTLHTTTAGATATIVETFEFSAFGTPVSVSAPPSSDTVDFTQLFSGLGTGASSSS